MPGMTTFSGQKPAGHGMGRRILEPTMPVPPEAMAGALSRSGAGSRLRARGRGHASLAQGGHDGRGWSQR